jgi:hypothetical protein
MNGCDRSLLRKAQIFERVLEMWRGGEKSTFCIAAELGVDEREVCRLIEEGEGRVAVIEGVRT